MLKPQYPLDTLKDKIDKNGGFSLLEVSISLAIMGLIIGLGMPPLISILNLGKVRTTEKHQEAVMTALAAYGLQHGHLPCPATLDNPGYALTTCHKVIHIVGTIPYYTLGIPAQYAHDGFKRPMSYAVNTVIVDQNAGREGTKSSNSEADQLVANNLNVGNMPPKRIKKTEVLKPLLEVDQHFCNGANLDTTDLQVYNKNSRSVMDNTKENFIAVVLVSSDKSSAKDLDIPTVFTDQPYSKDYPYILKWASRDFLSGFYGQYSCVTHRYKSIHFDR